MFGLYLTELKDNGWSFVWAVCQIHKLLPLNDHIFLLVFYVVLQIIIDYYYWAALRWEETGHCPEEIYDHPQVAEDLSTYSRKDGLKLRSTAFGKK